MRNKQLKEGQVGSYWPSQKPGRKRPGDSWCLTWYDKGARQTRRESLGTTDFREACLKVAEYALLKEQPQDAKQEEILISTCLLMYWEERGKHLVSWRTAKYHLRLWNEFWGDRTVADMTRDQQAKFRKYIGEGRLTPSSVDKILSTGNAAFNLAKHSGMLRDVPKIILIEKEEDRRERSPMGTPITPALAARLLDAVNSRHLFFFIVIIANTLARNGAVYDMRREQFDDVENILKLNPPGRRQNKKFRSTVLVTPTLRKWLLSVDDPKALLVSRDGKRVACIRKAWDTAANKAGLPKGITPYSFRHGIAREMRRRGVPMDQISHYLGHLPRGGAKTTSIYAPMEAQDCKEAAAAIEAVMTEIRALLKVAKLDDPCALFAEDANGRLQNGNLGKSRQDELVKLIKAGTASLRFAVE